MRRRSAGRKAATTKTREEVLYGYHPVVEMLRAGRRTVRGVHLAAHRSAARLDRIAKMAASRGLPVDRRPPAELDRLAGHPHHQGVAATVGPFPLLTEKHLLRTLEHTVPCFLLLLDQLQDPHNLGALVRTAYCAGVDAVVITRHRSAGPTPAVSRVSAGALEHMTLVEAGNLVALIKRLRSSGVWTAGLDGGADQPVFTADLTGPLALVIGGEESGMRPLVTSHCDFHLAIPHAGAFNSLNASAAGAVALFEAYRQRHRMAAGEAAQPGGEDIP